ncbi:MAG: META domain-containing protein [Cyclobacteriaceae bacterium]
MYKLLPLLFLFYVIGCKNPNRKTEPLKNGKLTELTKVDSSKVDATKVEDQSKLLIGSWDFVDIGEGYVKLPILRFMDQVKLIGNDGCNQFFGHYKAYGQSISFEAISSTKKKCANLPENKILINLDAITSFKIEDETLALLKNDQLLLKLKRTEE